MLVLQENQLVAESRILTGQNEVRREEEALELSQEKPPLRIDPDGRFKRGWDVFMLLMVYYVSLVTPLNLAFFSNNESHSELLQPYQASLFLF